MRAFCLQRPILTATDSGVEPRFKQVANGAARRSHTRVHFLKRFRASSLEAGTAGKRLLRAATHPRRRAQHGALGVWGFHAGTGDFERGTRTSADDKADREPGTHA
jgi:hypothetical protein